MLRRIAEAETAGTGSEEYRSVVVNKGAMVFHMLRSIIGDANFSALLKDFYSRYAGKPARIQDFEQLAETHTAKPAPQEFKLGNASGPTANRPTFGPFFTQWLRSTGVPEFTLEYVTYRTKKGFRIVGKVKQNLDVFHMDVEMEVQTEGNPEFKTVTIAGKESPFTVETFGRPETQRDYPRPAQLHPEIEPAPARAWNHCARRDRSPNRAATTTPSQQYQRALEQDRTNALADFRMGEAFFYQRNYAAAAQSFRDALDGATDLTTDGRKSGRTSISAEFMISRATVRAR